MPPEPSVRLMPCYQLLSLAPSYWLALPCITLVRTRTPSAWTLPHRTIICPFRTTPGHRNLPTPSLNDRPYILQDALQGTNHLDSPWSQVHTLVQTAWSTRTLWPTQCLLPEHGPDSEAAPTKWLVYAPFREEKRKILNSSSTPPSMGQQNEPQDAHPECAHTGHDYFHRWPHVNWTLRLPCSAKRELSPHAEHRYAHT